MIKTDDIIVGQKVEILRGRHAGKTGTIVDFKFEDSGDLSGNQLDIEIDGTGEMCYPGQEDVHLVDPYKSFWSNIKKSYKPEVRENKINKHNMKKLVVESLDEFLFETKMAEKEDKAKTANVDAEKAKSEKSKAKKQTETPEDKAAQAIKALKDEIAKAKKPGSFKTVAQKNAKIKELEAKIKAWEKKSKK